jgi:hypothetical protein
MSDQGHQASWPNQYAAERLDVLGGHAAGPSNASVGSPPSCEGGRRRLQSLAGCEPLSFPTGILGGLHRVPLFALHHESGNIRLDGGWEICWEISLRVWPDCGP